MSICVICGDYLLQSKQINTFLRSLRLQNIIILLKIMKERQIVMDLCTIFAHKVKIGCTLDEKQMEMQTLNKKADATREKDIYRVTVVGSVVNFLLLVFKFFAGIVGHSAAMLADAVHSLSDFITDIIVIVFVRISAKPEDEGHDYGHGKYETLATAIIGIFLLFVGFGIFWNGASSIYRFLQGGSLQEPGILALVAALVSIVFKEVLYQYTVFKGRKLNSQAVVANAWHHRSDAFSSIGTAAGIGGAILLGDHWRVLDPVAAVIVSFFIMKVAVQLLIPCVDELLEKSLPVEVEDEILKTILSFPGISSPHHLRTRRIGSYCAIEVHVRMDGSISLEEAHETATAVENKLKRQFGKGTLVSIHVEQGGSLQEPGILALVAALVSIVFKEVLYQYTVFKGRKLNSQAVVANAWHHRSDAFSSIGTAAGIGGAILLGDHWRVLDPVAAVIVSFFIMKVAVQLLIPCVDELLEKSLPVEVEDEILKTILSFPGISSPHHLRTRRIGSYCAIEVHVRMDGSISLEEAHETATAVENKLKRQFGKGTLVSIHVEPVKKSNEATE